MKLIDTSRRSQIMYKVFWHQIEYDEPKDVFKLWKKVMMNGVIKS